MSSRRLLPAFILLLVVAWSGCPCVYARMLGLTQAPGADAQVAGTTGAAPTRRCCCCDEPTPPAERTERDGEDHCICSHRGGNDADQPPAAPALAAADLDLLYALIAPDLSLGLAWEGATDARHASPPFERPPPADLRPGTVLLV